MVNDLSFENDEGIVKKNGAEACRSDNDDYSDSEKACINSALNILVYANNTEKKLREKLYRKGYSNTAMLKARAILMKTRRFLMRRNYLQQRSSTEKKELLSSFTKRGLNAMQLRR